MQISSGFYKDFSSTRLGRPSTKKAPKTYTAIIIILFSLLLIVVWISCSWIDLVIVASQRNSEIIIAKQQPKEEEAPVRKVDNQREKIIVEQPKVEEEAPTIPETKVDAQNETHVSQQPKKEAPKTKEKVVKFPLNCSPKNVTQTCSSEYPTTWNVKSNNIKGGNFSNVRCPDYFRWIHEDLKTFKATGITREMVDRARKTAHFRLTIVKGKAYVEKYKESIQTRDAFTLWGILQLLRRYPGRLPDLELMFDCNDRPVIKSRSYRRPNAAAPPPLFRYCSDPWSLDIVFPDWSFWGWAEINIKPWEQMLKEIRVGNKRIGWMKREPYAYWKGNPFVAETRQDLLKCNASQEHDWNARLFIQDWIREWKIRYKHSGLGEQCTYRYKIYIEGYAWSVSEKYILACNSPTFFVNTRFHDIFLRNLEPLRHYWPIKHNDKCRSIKFGVNWGNNHHEKAQEIGRAASDFMQEELKMEFVYDYMFHLLNEYAKLLKFEPKIPEKGEELCSEKMVCHAEEGNGKKFKMESLVKRPSQTSPCNLPPPYEPGALAALLRRQVNTRMLVDTWEKNFYENMTAVARV